MESHFYPDKVQTGVITVSGIHTKLSEASSKISSASNIDERIKSRLSFDFAGTVSEINNYVNDAKQITQNINNVLLEYYKITGQTTEMSSLLGLNLGNFDVFGALSAFFTNPLQAINDAANIIGNFWQGIVGNIQSFFNKTGAFFMGSYSSLLPIQINQAFNVSKNQSLYDFFSSHNNSRLNEFGVNQGIFRDLLSTDVNEYKRLKEKLMNMGFSRKDAHRILSLVDSTGVCSYAATCNEIIDQFRSCPEVFEKIFGYPMFDAKGNLNGEELLLDIYLFENQMSNGGSLFNGTEFAPTDEMLKMKFPWVSDSMLNTAFTKNQQYLYYSRDSKKGIEEVNNYLSSKNPGLYYSREEIVHGNLQTQSLLTALSPVTAPLANQVLINDAKNKINAAIASNKTVSLGVEPGNSPITFRTRSTANMDVSFNGGHVVTVVGADDEGVLVSSWGGKYRVDWEELEKVRDFYIDVSEIGITSDAASQLQD